MSDELSPGLYEVIVDAALAERLSHLDGRLVDRRARRSVDAADRIAQHLARLLRQAVDCVPDADRVTRAEYLTETGLEGADVYAGQRVLIYSRPRLRPSRRRSRSAGAATRSAPR